MDFGPNPWYGYRVFQLWLEVLQAFCSLDFVGKLTNGQPRLNVAEEVTIGVTSNSNSSQW